MAVIDTPLLIPAQNFESDQKAHRVNNAQLEAYAQGIQTNLCPVGSILMYAGTVAPAGWFLCNGASKSRTQYEALFTVIGVQYGGSGAEFNLPDLTSDSSTELRLPVGAGVGLTLGATSQEILSSAVTSQGNGIAVNFIIKY